MIRYEIAFHPQARVSILYRCSQEVALLSRSAIEEARRHLPGFPAAEHLPRPARRTPEGRFQYVPGAWTAATKASVVTEFRGTKRKYDPTKWRQLRTDFCDIWSLSLEEVATPTAQFFREHGALRVFAAEAGGGGDCFFLSTAVVLMQARAVHPRLLNLFTSDEVADWDDRITVAAALRKIVGRHMRAKTPKAFLKFVVGCLVREAARTWLDRTLAWLSFCFLERRQRCSRSRSCRRRHASSLQRGRQLRDEEQESAFWHCGPGVFAGCREHCSRSLWEYSLGNRRRLCCVGHGAQSWLHHCWKYLDPDVCCSRLR